MKTILVADDDQNFARALECQLRERRYDVASYTSLSSAWKRIQADAPDLAIIEVGMRGEIDGWGLLRKLRDPLVYHGPDIRIIVASALADEASRVLGLELGANDYMTKPVFIGELLARVKLQLGKRPFLSPGFHGPFKTGGFTILPHQPGVKMGGKIIALTPREFQLLSCLAARPGMTCSPQWLLNEVWEGVQVDKSIVRVYISNLRRKLAGLGIIRTTPHGYTITGV